MDTIYALSSGPGRAAVAVLRVSGPLSTAIATGLGCGNLPPRTACLRTLVHPQTGAELDRAIVIYFAGPASFTGENSIELHVHGGRAVVTAVQNALAFLGARPAMAGEFTRRAFENGKLDLTAVEGLSDLLSADTEAQRAQALMLARGGLSDQISVWREQLIKLMAAVEVDVDFVEEEDAPSLDRYTFIVQVERLMEDIRRALNSSQRGKKTREGFMVVIAGPPNVGKSTLINALAGRDVAIVSDVPGTTRDSLEVHLDLSGHAVVFVDTAGLRHTDDQIESIGISRTLARVNEADLVLWLQSPDADGSVEQPSGSPVVAVRTKSDLNADEGEGLFVSALTGQGLDELLHRVVNELDLVADRAEPALVTHERQIRTLERTLEALGSIEIDMPVELIAENLRRATRSLAHLAGAVDVEDVLAQIFVHFCIGK